MKLLNMVYKKHDISFQRIAPSFTYPLQQMKRRPSDWWNNSVIYTLSLHVQSIMAPIYRVNRKTAYFQWGHSQDYVWTFSKRPPNCPSPHPSNIYLLFELQNSATFLFIIRCFSRRPLTQIRGTPLGFQTCISRSQLKGIHPVRDTY